MPEKQRIADLLDRLGRLARALQFCDGLNPAQWETLRFFARANRYSRTPGALAGFLGVTRGTASQTLIALEAKGYVRRSRCPADRRSVDIALTDEGRDLLTRDPLCRLREAAEALSAAQRSALIEGMDGLLKSLQRIDGLPEFGRCFGCDHFRDGGLPDAPCRCALTGEALDPDELTHICIDFTARPVDCA